MEEEDDRGPNLLVDRVAVEALRGNGGGDNGGFRSLGVRGKGKSEVEIAIVAELSSGTENLNGK